MVDKSSQAVVCTAFSAGRKHDFRLFKESRVHALPTTKVLADSGYIGLARMHVVSEVPKKKSKLHPLSKEDKQKNRLLAQRRVLNENVIGDLKRFKILSDRYRNRRKRFGLRFNLIAGIHNYELLPRL